MSKEFIKLYPIVEKNLKEKKNIDQLKKYIQKYFDENSEILSDTGLSSKPIFNKSGDQEAMFKATGLTREQVQEALKKTDSTDVKRGWVIWSNEVYLTFTLALRYFTLSRNKEMATLIYMYMTMLFYTALYRKYFPLGFAKKEVMDYTINNLSLKFDIKRLGSLFATLKKFAENNDLNAKRNLIKTDDAEIIKYPRDLRTRLNSLVQNISNEFRKNYEEGNYLNVDAEEIDVGEETLKRERESDSSAVVNAAQSYHIWFMSNKTDERILRWIEDANPDVNSNKLRGIIDSTKEGKADAIYSIALGIFDLLSEHQKDSKLKAVCNTKFSTFVIKALSKSNTKDQNVLMIKNNVDALLKKHSDRYRETSREATKISYRKALLYYIAYSIQVQRCHSK